MDQLQRTWMEITRSLFKEELLDSQYTQLQMLQDESNPDFVYEVVTLFFKDSERILNDISFSLVQPVVNFSKVDAHAHQLKGSSSSIGASRVKNACIALRSYCDEHNVEACIGWFHRLQEEYYLVKAKLEALFRLEQQIIAGGGVVPVFIENPSY